MKLTDILIRVGNMTIKENYFALSKADLLFGKYINDAVEKFDANLEFVWRDSRCLEFLDKEIYLSSFFKGVSIPPRGMFEFKAQGVFGLEGAIRGVVDCVANLFCEGEVFSLCSCGAAITNVINLDEKSRRGSKFEGVYSAVAVDYSIVDLGGGFFRADSFYEDNLTAKFNLAIFRIREVVSKVCGNRVLLTVGWGGVKFNGEPFVFDSQSKSLNGGFYSVHYCYNSYDKEQSDEALKFAKLMSSYMMQGSLISSDLPFVVVLDAEICHAEDMWGVKGLGCEIVRFSFCEE